MSIYESLGLQEFDLPSSPVDMEAMSYNIVSRLHESQVSPEEIDKAKATLAPLSFGIRPEGGSLWGVYFAPRYTEKNALGVMVGYPELDKLSSLNVNEWASLADALKNSVLRARFADAVWECARLLLAERIDRHRFGVVAAESYLQGSIEGCYPYSIQQHAGIARAVSIAMQLNNKEILDRAIDCSLQAANAASQGNMGIWLAPFDLLANKRLPQKHIERIVLGVEERFTRSLSLGDIHQAMMAGKALARHYNNTKDYKNAQRCVLLYGNLKVVAAADLDSFLAVHHLSEVVSSYRQLGLRKEADAAQLILEQRAQGITGEMHSEYFEIPLDVDAINESLQVILDTKHPYAALFRMARCIAPKVDEIRARMRTNSAEFVLYNLFPVSIIGSDGLPVAIVSGNEEDSDGRLVMEVARDMNLGVMFLLKGIEAWKIQFGLDGMIDVPTIYDSLLIPSSRISIIREGVAAYESGDFVKCIHVLIPQIENCLRELLRLLGIPLRKPPADDGTFELKNINDILHDTNVRDCLDDNLWYFLKVLYVDKRGLNLRNVVAHGAAETGTFNKSNAALVLQSLILLTVIRPEAVSCDA